MSNKPKSKKRLPLSVTIAGDNHRALSKWAGRKRAALCRATDAVIEHAEQSGVFDKPMPKKDAP